jgi:hypothetical protein
VSIQPYSPPPPPSARSRRGIEREKRAIRTNVELALYRIEGIDVIANVIIEKNADLLHLRSVEATGDHLTDALAATVQQAAVFQMMRELRNAYDSF